MNITNIFKRQRSQSDDYVSVIVGGDAAALPLRYGAGLKTMRIAASNRCVNLIANTVASMPLHYQKRDGGEAFHDATADPLHAAFLYRPNPYMTAFEFKRVLARRMLLDGVVYIIPDPAGNFYIENKFAVQANNKTHAYQVTDPTFPHLNGVYPEDEIVVIRHLTPDGLAYESADEVLSETLQLVAAGDNEAYTRITSGGQPYMLFKDSRPITGTGTRVEEARKNSMTQLQNKTSQGQRCVWLPPGVDAEVVGASAADMQFQSIRDFAVRDICRFFGVPPMLVFSDSNSSYKSPEAANLDFLANCLNPILCNIEGALLAKLIKPTQWGKRRFHFDRRNRLIADQQSQARYMQTLMGLGVTPNEIRSSLDLDAVDGGDAPLVSANLRPLDEINQTTPNNEQD